VLAAVKRGNASTLVRAWTVSMGLRDLGGLGKQAGGANTAPSIASSPYGQKPRKCAILGPGAGGLVGVAAGGLGDFPMLNSRA
jgi:hypothetical protein